MNNVTLHAQIIQPHNAFAKNCFNLVLTCNDEFDARRFARNHGIDYHDIDPASIGDTYLALNNLKFGEKLGISYFEDAPF